MHEGTPTPMPQHPFFNSDYRAPPYGAGTRIRADEVNKGEVELTSVLLSHSSSTYHSILILDIIALRFVHSFADATLSHEPTLLPHNISPGS